MINRVKPDLESDDSFFMNYDDFVVNFDLVHICMVDKFQEIQTKGVFKIFGMDHLFSKKNPKQKSNLLIFRKSNVKDKFFISLYGFN